MTSTTTEASKPAAAQEAVAYWLAVDEDGAVAFGVRADNEDDGETARQEVAEFIDGRSEPGTVRHGLVGAYAAPVAAAPAWVVANGQGDKWRKWGDFGPEWTADRNAALHFARRSDAEAFSAEDEDAWLIQPVGTAAAPGIDLATVIRNCCEADKADPDHPYTICINVNELTAIMQQCVIDASPKGGSDAQMVPYQRALDLIGDAYNAGTHGIGYSQQAMELHDALQATSAEVGS